MQDDRPTQPPYPGSVVLDRAHMHVRGGDGDARGDVERRGGLQPQAARLAEEIDRPPLAQLRREPQRQREGGEVHGADRSPAPARADGKPRGQ
eukprot:CAMPEP_0182833204 /NCGR_PEP_ID=MMETSP0006_2-20121128/20163_1 /TAXON_ID=97485 /ORGANISM="Prymnesium parvum, Strain Texoma1" /LENGTH=92 /DNA_ID=CAMNT_0024961181 /DNA_START=8 /DNA_END=283 /DNA_ORIENTATION=-